MIIIPNAPDNPDDVTSLRSRALAASPTMVVDQAEVLARGRRVRLGRTLGGTVGVLAVAGLAVFAAAQLWGGHRSPPPAEHSAPIVLPDPVPSWVAEHGEKPIVRQLAPGVRATVRPARWRLTDGTTLAVSGLGITEAGSPASWWGLVQVTADQVNASEALRHAPGNRSVEPWAGELALRLVYVSGADRTESLSFLGWNQPGDLSGYFRSSSTNTVSPQLNDGVGGKQQVLALSIPSSMVDPDVRLCLASLSQESPYTSADIGCVTDVPVFRVPTDQTHQMLVVSSDLVGKDGAALWFVGGVLTAKNGATATFGICGGQAPQSGASAAGSSPVDLCAAGPPTAGMTG